MKKLILLRHGDYSLTVEGDGELNERGQQKISSIANQLKAFCSGSTKLVSSTAIRARQSAQILSDVLDLEVDEQELFWSDHDHREQPTKAVEFIQGHAENFETIIIVTHYEYVEILPWKFGKDVLGTEMPFEEINKGNAWIIDCEAKTCKLMTPDH